MLYIYYSDNPSLSADKARALVKSLMEKKPDSTLIKVEDNTFSKDILEENIGGQGLFSSKYIIYLDRVIKNKDHESIIGEYLVHMSESENVFIISEGSLNGEILKLMNKYATKIICVEDKTAKVKKSINEIFILTDYFASRKNIQAWEIYRRLIDSGVEAENIVGTLFWQLKSMVLAYNNVSATESGLNPYVFSKSKKFSSYWSYDEIVNSLKDLTVSYHEAHRGNCNLEKNLELFILKNIKNERKDI